MGNMNTRKRQECEDTSSFKSFETPKVRYTNTGFSSLIASRIQTATDEDYRVFLCGDMNGWNRVVPRDKYNGDRKPDATTSRGFTRRESISAWVNKIVAYGHSYDESTDDRTTSTSERSWAFAERFPNVHRRVANHNTKIYNNNNNNGNSSSVESSTTSSNASSCLEGHRNRGSVFYSMYNHSNVKNEFAKKEYYLYAREPRKPTEVEMPNSKHSDFSQRALDVIHYPDPLLKYVDEVKKNPYKQHHENGVVDIGLAENRLCEDLIQEKLTEILPAKIESEWLHYSVHHGSVSFRRAIKNFLNKFFNPLNPIDEENIVVVTGVTCVLDLVAFSLAEEGDCFLCPTPYYSRIRNDLHDKSRVHTYDFDILETDSHGQVVYRLTREKLQMAYREAQNMGICIKGILVVNPNNPTGQFLTKEEICHVLEFAKVNNIHAVFDEIYGLSSHCRKNTFRSVLSVVNPDPDKTHFMWGLSKDLGLSGFRCGMLHSTNQALLKFVQKVAFFTSVPLFIQQILETLLNETQWLETKYFPTIQQRLKDSYEIASERLKKLGVTIYPSDGGFFIWANFSKFMQDKSFKGEEELFKLFFKHKVFFANGLMFYAKEPGWFRIIFTQKLEVLQVGLDRIEQALTSIAG